MKQAHDRWAAAEKEGSCLHTQRSAKSSPHLLPVTLPTGGRGRLAPTQMHAGIVFLFILSLPCRHVLFFFSPPTFLQLFCVPPSTVCLCVSILFFWLFSFVQSSTLSASCSGEAEQISVSLTLVWFLFFRVLVEVWEKRGQVQIWTVNPSSFFLVL